MGKGVDGEEEEDEGGIEQRRLGGFVLSGEGQIAGLSDITSR